MNHLQLIIKREYLNKVKNKSFIIMTFLTPLIMIGLITLVAYLSQLNNDKENTISVLDESGLFVNQFQDTKNIKFQKLQNIDLLQAKEKVEIAENYGLLYIPKTPTIEELTNQIIFFSKESPSITVIEKIDRVIEEKVNKLNLQQVGIDTQKIEELHINISPKLETFKGVETSKMGSILKLAFGGIAGYLLFMFIIIYGNMIMRSVIEEKTSRIIEVIISSVKPIKLMLGKIIGTSLAGLTQFITWMILLGVLSTVVSLIFNIDTHSIPTSQQGVIPQGSEAEIQEMVTNLFIEINQLPLSNLFLMFLFFFIGGYLLYSSLYAAIGAAVDSETDTQQFMLPVLMPLIIGIYVGFFTVIENPHGVVSQVFSFIPFTSPVVMLMRIPFGVPIWQQILSLVILFATFIGTVWFAAKIYRVGILMYGKKPSYKELIKWLKY
ncbi:MAG: ABC transporter permease [Flavobacteriales bacterium]